jgi:hypothetical protein
MWEGRDCALPWVKAIWGAADRPVSARAETSETHTIANEMEFGVRWDLVPLTVVIQRLCDTLPPLVQHPLVQIDNLHLDVSIAELFSRPIQYPQGNVACAPSNVEALELGVCGVGGRRVGDGVEGGWEAGHEGGYERVLPQSVDIRS